MKILGREEVSAWLAKHSQIEDPFEGPVDPPFRVPFKSPMSFRSCECFVRAFLNQIVEQGEILVVVADASPAEPCHELLSNAVRTSIGERRGISDAPGYLIGFPEREQAVAIFSLMVSFAWKCYLYADHRQIVLYNWEGTIFDMWSDAPKTLQDTTVLIRNFGLEVVSET